MDDIDLLFSEAREAYRRAERKHPPVTDEALAALREKFRETDELARQLLALRQEALDRRASLLGG